MPEQEISIWQDEKEDQNAKRMALNKTITALSDGRISPLQSTLNTEWGAKVLPAKGKGNNWIHSVNHKSWARRRCLEIFEERAYSH